MSNYFEITLPTGTALTGAMRAQLLDPEGVSPSHIIRADDSWGVRFDWSLKGPLASCICGHWCLRVRLESIGDGPELSLFKDREVTIPLDPCGNGNYTYDFRISAGTVSGEACGPVYKTVATLTYVGPCGRPGPIAGFADLGLVQFYEDRKNG